MAVRPSQFYLLTVGTCLIPHVGYSWLCSAIYNKEEMSSQKKGLFANRNEREKSQKRNKNLLLITKHISSAHISLTKAKYARSYISRKGNYKSFHRKKQWAFCTIIQSITRLYNIYIKFSLCTYIIPVKWVG